MQKFINVILNLFDGEGGGDGATGAESAPQAAAEGTGENVLYGIQPDEVESDDMAVAEPEGEETLSPEERRRAYDEFINSDDYKEFYTEDTQKMINRRFKEMKNLERQLADYQPVMSMLSQMYGVSDINGIKQAIENDNSFWSDKAFEAGMDVEQFKKISRLERENREMHQYQQQQEFNARVDRQMQDWYEQAERVRQFYPNFNFEAEQQNPLFNKLLMSNIDVKTAYETVHHDEMIRNAMDYQNRVTSKAVTDNIRAKGSRPLENGTSQQGAFIVKNNVNALNKADRAEIARRVRRGEIISF